MFNDVSTIKNTTELENRSNIIFENFPDKELSNWFKAIQEIDSNDSRFLYILNKFSFDNCIRAQSYISDFNVLLDHSSMNSYTINKDYNCSVCNEKFHK